MISGLPNAAQKYFEHAIAPGTPLAAAIRLRMHGEIKLRRWLRFSAEQVITWNRGFIWEATVWMGALPIVGSDRLLHGAGAMKWNVLGVIPVMTASGMDITRSAAGRFAAELVWLPSALLCAGATWTARDLLHVGARLSVQEEPINLDLTIDEQGRLKNLTLLRWGNPGGSAFSYVTFGGIAEDERTFGGYSIPTRLRIGYFAGTQRFESEGEFIRITIDDVAYR